MPVKPGSGTENPRSKPGGEDRSVAHDTDPKKENKYPHPDNRDRQMDNQPEFIETEPNRKDKEDE